MSDNDDFGEGISTGVLTRIAPDGDDFLSDKGIDIEKVISLLTASGLDEHLLLAGRMRQAYFDEICERLVRSNILATPTLSVALLEMHRNALFGTHTEKLTGILTTNHDGLLQVAFKQTFGAVDLGFPFLSSQFSPANGTVVPPLLQLHGSFTWSFGAPLGIEVLDDSSAYSANAIWIPPSVSKESKNYPFNKLTGSSYELLSKHCDTLRVIGSAMTQNDWNILSLVFNAQRHSIFLSEAPFTIELIMPQKDALATEKSSAYLANIIPMASLKDGDFSPYEDWSDQYPPSSLDEANPFFYWLNQKLNFHQSKGEFGADPLVGIMAKVAGGIA
jgi:hypothetical protein